MMTEPRTDDVVEVVRARRFELVDHAGRVLAVLEARDETHGEGGSLTICDAEGHSRVLLTGYADGGNVTASLSGKDGLHIA